MDKEWSFTKIWECVLSSWLGEKVKMSKPLFLFGCVISFVFGYLLTALLVAYPIKDGGHLAAWVQAFGSIGALGVAFYVMHRQVKMQREQSERLKARERLKHLNILLRCLVYIANSSNMFYKDGKFTSDVQGSKVLSLIVAKMENALATVSRSLDSDSLRERDVFSGLMITDVGLAFLDIFKRLSEEKVEDDIIKIVYSDNSEIIKKIEAELKSRISDLEKIE